MGPRLRLSVFWLRFSVHVFYPAHARLVDCARFSRLNRSCDHDLKFIVAHIASRSKLPQEKTLSTGSTSVLSGAS